MTQNRTTRTFYYNASRDILGAFIGGFLFLIIFFLLIKPLPSVPYSESDMETLLIILKWTYIICMFLWVPFSFLTIFSMRFSSLFIGTDEIVHRKGWLSKQTTSIPACKIRSCSKHSGILQRFCHTMDLSITTAGDSTEIFFSNISDGDRAFQMISDLAKKNHV